jgi:hypothetical protein
VGHEKKIGSQVSEARKAGSLRSAQSHGRPPTAGCHRPQILYSFFSFSDLATTDRSSSCLKVTSFLAMALFDVAMISAA